MQATRIILTVDQARSLQREQRPAFDYGAWQFLRTVTIPPESIKQISDDQIIVGIAMLERGCSYEQIAEQLNWKTKSHAVLERAYRLHERMKG